MNSGDFNRKIEFFSKSSNTLILTRWANIKTLSANKITSLLATNNIVTHQITIRFTTKVDRTMYIKYKGRKFNIETDIDKDERHEYLTLVCKEVK